MEFIPNKDGIQKLRKMSDEPPERACSSTKAAEKKKISLKKSVKLDSIKS